ncbi:MAG: hypothetical protein JWP29_3687, partial [Rhodoferax sp.]|nr:hypothetical protein [Rhodoferax sp.]
MWGLAALLKSKKVAAATFLL